MASTSPLSFTQPGGTPNVRTPNTPRFAGGPQGASSASGAHTPREDSFERQGIPEDLDTLLQRTQGDMGNIEALLASLDEQEKAGKALKGDQAAISAATIQGKFPSIGSPNPSNPAIESPDALLTAINDREQELKKSWLPQSVNKFLYPSTMDGFSPSFKNTLGDLHALKADGKDLNTHFAEQNAQLKTKQNAALQKQLESQKQMMRDMLKESDPSLNDTQIEERIEAFYKEQQPEVEASLKAHGLDEQGIKALNKKLGLTEPDQEA